MIETVSALINLMKSHGATRFYAKKLAPNDNSKNQIYLGGDYSALNIIPYNNLHIDGDDVAGSKRDRAKADICFSWVSEQGVYEAPNARLILYPKYPEVRMSGFLKGCMNSPSAVMSVRDEGRVLFLGITGDGCILGYAAGADEPLARAVYASANLQETGVFLEILPEPEKGNSREQLLAKLTEIFQKGWINSQKLNSRDGLPYPYVARNAGGYTLEAELGIRPNGYSAPDYLGWEIKQYGVKDFMKFAPNSAVTLMTPEPTGGIYREEGLRVFIERYGYADKRGLPDRMNFGGIHRCGAGFNQGTDLQLALTGYDHSTGKIADMGGGIALMTRRGETAAIWEYSGILKHWNKKHALAAYIPSLSRGKPPSYSYGPRVLLCEKTDFSLFLKGLHDGVIFYDPGIKMERACSDNPKIKQRSQFRVNFRDLDSLYASSAFEYLDA